MAKLNAVQVRALSEPGRYPAGEGLIVNVKPGGSKSWLFRLQTGGQRREYGLGSISDVSLAEAREAAAAIRKQARAGLDPLAEKRKARKLVPTFREAALAVHAEHKRGWKNGKHQAQWLATLNSYAFPEIGDMPVNKIESGHVRDVLGPIWLDKPETARRVRQRIGTVLDYAVGNNWRPHPLSMGSVTKALPRQPRKDGRFEAMPFLQVPGFLETLRFRSSMGRLALEALILTAARSGEVRGARWSELDLEAATWTIPAERMKAGRTHVVPLSPAALATFKRAQALRLSGAELIFPGTGRGKTLSDMTLLKVLRDAGLKATVHGFRSAFRDWAAERTGIPGEVAEAALAHVIPNRVEAAYRRTDFLEKRRELMKRWGVFCEGEAGKVVRFVTKG
jgi:integrase